MLSKHFPLFFPAVWSWYVPSQVPHRALLCTSVSCSGFFLDWHLSPKCISRREVGKTDWHEGFSAVFLSGYLRAQRGAVSQSPLSAQELTPVEGWTPGHLTAGATRASCPSDCACTDISQNCMPLHMNLLKNLLSIYSPGQFSYRLWPVLLTNFILKVCRLLPITNSQNAAAVGKPHVQGRIVSQRQSPQPIWMNNEMLLLDGSQRNSEQILSHISIKETKLAICNYCHVTSEAEKVIHVCLATSIFCEYKAKNKHSFY